MTKPIMVECRMADEVGGAPSPPPNLVQAIAAILTRRDEQTALLRRLVEQGAAPRPGHHHPPAVPGDPAATISQGRRATGSRQLAQDH